MMVETKLWHYLHLLDNLRAQDVAAINAFTEEGVSEAWAINSYRGSLFSWTFIDARGMPYAIWALYEIIPGVLHVWSVGTEMIFEKAAEWFPKLKRTMNSILQNTDTHRIECYVLDGFEGAERTIRRLGFEYEGTRRSAGAQRENALLFAKVTP